MSMDVQVKVSGTINYCHALLFSASAIYEDGPTKEIYPAIMWSVYDIENKKLMLPLSQFRIKDLPSEDSIEQATAIAKSKLHDEICASLIDYMLETFADEP